MRKIVWNFTALLGVHGSYTYANIMIYSSILLLPTLTNHHIVCPICRISCSYACIMIYLLMCITAHLDLLSLVCLIYMLGLYTCRMLSLWCNHSTPYGVVALTISMIKVIIITVANKKFMQNESLISVNKTFNDFKLSIYE